MAPPHPVRTVFSVLYAEADGFLEVFVRNFLLFTGSEALLVVNLPAGRGIASASAAASERVHLIHGDVVRSKIGHTLLAGHIESLRFASDLLGDFDYFCPMASNSLFVRRLDLEAVEGRLAVPAEPFPAPVPLDDLPDRGWWKVLREDGRLVPFLRDRWHLSTACSFQIEGNLACRADWILVGQRLDEMLALPELALPVLPFPVEEILPEMVFQNFGSRRRAGICHLYWDRGPAAPVTIADIVGELWRMPPEVCMAKWFARSALDPATAAVTTLWGIDLLAYLSGEAGDGVEERLGRRLMLGELARSLRAREGFEPVTERWRPDPAMIEDHALLLRRALPAGYHVLTLDETMRTDGGEAAAYAIVEDIGQSLDLEVRIALPAGAIRIVAGGSAGTGEAGLVPIGYLYVNPLVTTRRSAIRVRAPQPVPPAVEELLRRLAIRYGPHQSALPERYRQHLPGHVEAYFTTEELDLSGGFWLGLPFFRDTGLDLVVEVL